MCGAWPWGAEREPTCCENCSRESHGGRKVADVTELIWAVSLQTTRQGPMLYSGVASQDIWPESAPNHTRLRETARGSHRGEYADPTPHPTSDPIGRQCTALVDSGLRVTLLRPDMVPGGTQLGPHSGA